MALGFIFVTDFSCFVELHYSESAIPICGRYEISVEFLWVHIVFRNFEKNVGVNGEVIVGTIDLLLL